MNALKLIPKHDVAKMLCISERHLEKLVKAERFPPGFHLGKRVLWTEPVIEKWLSDKLAVQVAWEPPKPKSRRKLQS